jgi:uncharacterized protein (DUF2236 family)
LFNRKFEQVYTQFKDGTQFEALAPKLQQWASCHMNGPLKGGMTSTQQDSLRRICTSMTV